MNKFFYFALTILAVISCNETKKSQITYRKQGDIIHFNNKEILLEIDNKMKIIPSYNNGSMVLSIAAIDSEPNDYLVVDGKKVTEFFVSKKEVIEINTDFGLGKQLKLYGKSHVFLDKKEINIQKVLTIELYENFPNTAITYTEYTNLSDTPLIIDKVVETQYMVDRKLTDSSKLSYDFSLFQGCGVDWGLDYANIKVDSAYKSTNSMGVKVAKRDPSGGGIPLLDLWGKEMGMAIAHISKKPEFVNLPIQTLPNGYVQYSIEEPYSQQYQKIKLSKGMTFSSIKNIVIVHSLDYFDALRTYAECLNIQGIKTFKETQGNIPSSYWKTWGYELNFKVSDIYKKVPEFKELGIEMVVLDDGWFSNYGDWEPSTEKDKFPEGDSSLIKFVKDMHKEGLKVGVWWSPLAVEPFSAVAKAHPDWFMLQIDNTPYTMKEPDSYFLCPDYAPVLKFWESQIEKLYINYDLDFVYHDWGNLIEVPPCYNPAHKHESPLAPYWNMSKQYQVMYDKALSIKPGSAIEMCECGRPHDPYKMPYYNITNASDATSKAQVREKLKVEKALNGSKVFFNPGYILPESKEDWGYDPCEIDECVAMGGYFETYYTELPSDKKNEWLKWMKIYHEEQIYRGEYLNLYDIANDVPEFHVTKKGANLYYFAPGPYNGKVELRGLSDAEYHVIDYSTNDTISKIRGPIGRVNINTNNDIYLKVILSEMQ